MRQTGAGEQLLRSAGSDNSAVGRARELFAWRPGPKGRAGARYEFRVSIGLGAKRWVFHKQTLGGVVGLRDGDEAKHSGPGGGGEERSLGREAADVLLLTLLAGVDLRRRERRRHAKLARAADESRGQSHTDTVNRL